MRRELIYLRSGISRSILPTPLVNEGRRQIALKGEVLDPIALIIGYKLGEETSPLLFTTLARGESGG
jgi:hypothetical protein